MQALLCASLVLSVQVMAQTAPRPAPPASSPAGPNDYFSNWPAGRSPQELGKALAEKFLPTPHVGRTIIYPEVCAWYGALTFAEVTHDTALRDKLVARFDTLLPGGSDFDARTPKRHHVDDSIYGVIPLEIAMQTKGLPGAKPDYLTLGTGWADRQWETPKPGTEFPQAAGVPADSGLSPETRYWIDDMYMLTMLQVQAYRATGDRKYIDRDAKEMVAYLDKLQQPNGLFYHAPDVQYFWGRGDGWIAAGMAETLRSLPADHPLRPRILAGYKLMMAALLKYQGPDGMWHQLIDKPDAWPETSSSAMFSFAMITGVKHGWLDGLTYGPAARKAWIAVSGYVDQHYDVTQVCQGTDKKDDLQYYYDRKRVTGDLHGQAPVMWAASALLRDEK
jgi:unsaturated rhamnogalacturonyl hydrolase